MNEKTPAETVIKEINNNNNITSCTNKSRQSCYNLCHINMV